MATVGKDAQGRTTYTFTLINAPETWTVPPGVSLIKIEAWGGEGGKNIHDGESWNGGKGGYAYGNLSVTPGESLTVVVGGKGGDNTYGSSKWAGGGYNGGGDVTQRTGDYDGAGCGGGASDVRRGGTGLADRIIVAGGGGGAGGGVTTAGHGGEGGAGGGLTGQNGQTAGGAGGAGGTQSTGNALGIGGNGLGGARKAGGAGGGGYWGGLAGASHDRAGGGGGGSSYYGGVTNGGTQTGVRTGDGQVVITILVSNQPPTLTLTSPSNNQTLVEGNTYVIAGTATEADAGNVVTVKYKIDNGTTYNITAAVSDGSTPLNFSKTLTYLNNRLYDGETAITPILDDKITHTLTVWAEDDKTGKSPDTVRNFTVLYNQPPQISGTDEDLGSISAPPSINYTVTDAEGYSFTVTEAVDGTTIRTFPGVDGQQETLTIPNDIWITLQPDVEHKLTITATDQYNASSIRTYTFKRTIDGIELVTKTPLPADVKPYRMAITLNGSYTGANVNVQVCNNGFDETPTWEDATDSVLNNRPYLFTNENKTAANWGILIKISILPGA